MTINKALEIEPELAKLYKQDSESRAVIDLAKKIEGRARHVGVHAAGVVIAPEPLDEFVPIQLDTKTGKYITQYEMRSVGEDGVGLSGGELQRIALARLYLRDPGLILLDEPTAHLDATTEARVLDGLFEFARGRTLLVATHSEAVAARMQRVYRIARGRLLPALHPRPNQQPRRGAA